MKYNKTNMDELLKRNPTKIPIIVDIDEKSDLKIEKTRFLVPKKYTFGQFISIFRERCTLSNKQALFFFIENKLPILSATIEELYSKREYNLEDPILYITVSVENTFG